MAVDPKWRSRIIHALRKLCYSYPPRKNQKNKQKIDKNLFECSKCGVYCYEGTSQDNYESYVNKYKNVIPEKGHMDHIVPVIDPMKGFEGFDIYIEKLFSQEENWRYLCQGCHKEKTKDENSLRISTKRKNKKTKEI